MPEDLLHALDAAFQRSRPEPATESAAIDLDDERAADPIETTSSEPWGWLEAFIIIQFAMGALLFVPGAQAVRSVVRASPYLASLGLLVYFSMKRTRGPSPGGAMVLLGALALLVLNLLHPTTAFGSGIAQIVFQLSIAAPAFFGAKAVQSARQAQRLLMLTFILNLASAGLGILQVYYPDQFMPPQFSSQLTQGGTSYVSSMTYRGSDGRIITRPPGMSDMPGGAAVAGGIAALLGMGLLLQASRTAQRAGLLAAVAVGLAVVYLTQVRSVLLMCLGAIAMIVFVAARQGRHSAAGAIAALGAAVVTVAFLWASSVGGEAVNERFLNIAREGAVETYTNTRGGFVSATMGELLNEYPLGAGVGRWGMMQTMFGDPTERSGKPIHVEIQLTGWLLDGGIPMWILYGGAVLASIAAAYRLTASWDPDVANLAILVFPLQLFVAGLSMAGPIFNTQTGLLFWTFGAVLQGVDLHQRLAAGAEDDASPAAATPRR